MRVVKLAIFASLTLATACSLASEPHPTVATVSMTLNRTSFRPLDTLVVTVVGTNITDHTIEVANYPCLANIDVRNERDEPVGLGDPRYCILPLYPPKVIAPGDTWGDRVTIFHPAAGTYRVRAGLPITVMEGFVYSEYTEVTVRP